jgi:hypothetical protein
MFVVQFFNLIFSYKIHSENNLTVQSQRRGLIYVLYLANLEIV